MTDPRYQSADDLLGTVRPEPPVTHAGWYGAEVDDDVAATVACGPCHRAGDITPLRPVDTPADEFDDSPESVTWECPIHGAQAFRMEGGVLDVGLVRHDLGGDPLFIEDWSATMVLDGAKTLLASGRFHGEALIATPGQTITERIDDVMAHYGFAPEAPSTSWNDDAAAEAASVWADMWRTLAGVHARDRERHRVREAMVAKQMGARTPLGTWWWGRKLARLR